jgi:putative oxidoreductase
MSARSSAKEENNPVKTASSVTRILLGIVFTAFGLNGFLNFIPTGPAPAGFAGQYLGALESSHYLTVVFVLEFVAGILLLMNRYVPFALTTLAAIIVNILLFHILMAPAGLPPAVIVALLWIGSVWNVRSAFGGLLQSRVTSQSAESSAAGSGTWAMAGQ